MHMNSVCDRADLAGKLRELDPHDLPVFLRNRIDLIAIIKRDKGEINLIGLWALFTEYLGGLQVFWPKDPRHIIDPETVMPGGDRCMAGKNEFAF